VLRGVVVIKREEARIAMLVKTGLALLCFTTKVSTKVSIGVLGNKGLDVGTQVVEWDQLLHCQRLAIERIAVILLYVSNDGGPERETERAGGRLRGLLGRYVCVCLCVCVLEYIWDTHKEFVGGLCLKRMATKETREGPRTSKMRCKHARPNLSTTRCDCGSWIGSAATQQVLYY
jgi:hypothetical protein